MREDRKRRANLERLKIETQGGERGNNDASTSSAISPASPSSLGERETVRGRGRAYSLSMVEGVRKRSSLERLTAERKLSERRGAELPFPLSSPHFPRGSTSSRTGSEPDLALEAFEVSLMQFLERLSLGIPCCKLEENMKEEREREKEKAGERAQWRKDLRMKLKTEKNILKLVWKDPTKIMSKVETISVSEILEVSPEVRTFSSREEFNAEHFLCIETGERRIGLLLKDKGERDELLHGLKSLVADLSLREGRMSNQAVPERRKVSAEMKKFSSLFRRFSDDKEKEMAPLRLSTSSSLSISTPSPRELARRFSLESAVLSSERETDLLRKKLIDVEQQRNNLLELQNALEAEKAQKDLQISELEAVIAKLQQTLEEEEEFSRQESALKMQLGRRLEQILLEKEELREERELLQQSFNSLMIRMASAATVAGLTPSPTNSVMA